MCIRDSAGAVLGVENFSEMPEVGQVTLPAGSSQNPFTEPHTGPGGVLDGREQRRYALPGHDPRPALQGRGPVVQFDVGGCGEPREIDSDEVGEDGRPDRGAPRLFERTQESQPVACRGGVEDRVGSGERHRYSGHGQCVGDLPSAAVGADQNGDLVRT